MATKNDSKPPTPPARPHPEGLTITEVRPMTQEELDLEGWDAGRGGNETPTVLVLSDGSKLYASQDPEGNGPGALFGTTPDGKKQFQVVAR